MFTMSEERSRFVDAACKIVAVVGIGIGAIWTFYTYFNARAREALTTGIEARKPFEAERLNLYLRAATAVATIATTANDAPEAEKAKKEFWTLYYGPLAIVDDPNVGKTMIAIAQCIDTPSACKKPLGLLALELDQNCRSSIAQGWNVSLPEDSVTFEELERLRPNR